MSALQPVFAVLGAGLLGKAIAGFLDERLAVEGKSMGLKLWTRTQKKREALASDFAHARLCDSVAEAAKDAALVVLAVPTSAVTEVSLALGEVARPDQILVHATRGFCSDALALPHDAVRASTCIRKIGVLGGPLYAPAMASKMPVAAVLASRFPEVHRRVGALVAGSNLRVHAIKDVHGVEVMGAVANIAALAVGMSEALGYGDTARGVLLTRALGEASRLATRLGGKRETFLGLAGVGELIPREVGSTKRHHEVGAALANGQALSEALSTAEGEVEGVYSAQVLTQWSALRGLDFPLAKMVHQVCAGKAQAIPALDEVLAMGLEAEL